MSQKDSAPKTNEMPRKAYDTIQLDVSQRNWRQTKNALIPQFIVDHKWIGRALMNGKIPDSRLIGMDQITRNIKVSGVKSIQNQISDTETSGHTDLEEMEATTILQEEKIKDTIASLSKITLFPTGDQGSTKYGTEENYIKKVRAELVQQGADHIQSRQQELKEELREKAVHESHDMSTSDINISSLLSGNQKEPDKSPDSNSSEDIDQSMSEIKLQVSTAIENKLKLVKKEYKTLVEEEKQDKVSALKNQMAQVRDDYKIIRNAEIKRRLVERKEYQDTIDMIDGIIIQKSTNATKDAIRNSAEYNIGLLNKDILMMWSALEKILQPSIGTKAADIFNCKMKINNKRMSNESIESYNTQYRDLVEQLELSEGTLSYPDAIHQYIQSLNFERYSQYQRSYFTNAKGDETLEDIMQQITEWDKTVGSSMRNLEKADQKSDTLTKRAHAVKSNNPDKRDDSGICFSWKKYGKCSRKDCKYSHESSNACDKVTGNNHNTTGTNSYDTNNNSNDNSKNQVCQHYLLGKCSYGKSCNKLHDDELKQKATAFMKTLSPKETSNNNNNIAKTVARCNESIQFPFGHVTQHAEAVCIPTVTTPINKVHTVCGGSKSTDKNVVMEDSGANINVIKDKSLFMTMEPKDGSECLSGIGGDGPRIFGEGKLKFPFEMMTAVYAPEATSNVLSTARLEDYYEPLPRQGFKSVKRHKLLNGARVIEFGYNHEDFMLYKRVVNLVDAAPTKEMLLSQGSTVKQIERARLVGTLHKRLSYASKQQLVDLADSNRIADCKLTSNDVKFYFDNMHAWECTGCAMGKQYTYPAVRGDPEPPKEIGDIIYWDEFHITYGDKGSSHTYILCKDAKSQFKFVHRVYNLQTPTIISMVNRLIGLLHNKGIKVGKLVWDQLPSHVEAATNIKNSTQIEIEYCAPGRHVRNIESDICEVKGAFMATLHGLNYKLQRRFYDNLVYYVVESINMLKSKSNPILTPYEMVMKSQIRLEYNVGVEFGQLVITKAKADDSKNNTEEALGELGIVIGRKLDTPGAVRIFKLGTGSEVIRAQYAPFGITPDIKAILEGKQESGDSMENVCFSWDTSGKESIGTDDILASTEFVYEIPTTENEFVEIGENTTQGDNYDTNEYNSDNDEVELVEEGDYTAVLEESGMSSESSENELTDVTNKNNTLILDSESVNNTIEQSDNSNDMISDDNQSESNKIHDDHQEDGNTGKPVYRRFKKLKGRPSHSFSKYNLRYHPGVRTRSRGISDCVTYSCKKTNMIEAKIKYGDKADSAILAEVHQMVEKDVWRYLTPKESQDKLSSGEKIIPSSIFLKEKFDAFNNFEKLKARLVACGNFQDTEDGENKFESPTASLTVTLMALETAAREKMVIKAADVGGAYLNGILDTKQLMSLQKSVSNILVENNPKLNKYVNKRGTITVQLQKGLYGLREASRIWYNTISTLLINNGYVCSQWDKCLFVKEENGMKTIIVLYVDDMLICGSNCKLVDDVIAILREAFHEITVKEGDKISFLGLEIVRYSENNSIKVSQGNYILKLIEEYEVTGNDKLPANDSLHLYEERNTENQCDKDEYVSLVMKIMYAAVRTRPDILYVTNVLASKCKEPSKLDMKNAIRILRYLNGTKDDGLLYLSDKAWRLHMSVDASFNQHADAKGHSGYVIFASEGSAGILFKSTKQKTVADSSTEAELIALHDGVKHLLWVSSIYAELGYNTAEAIQVDQDNKACIIISSDAPVNFKGRSKFINRKYFSVYEHVKNGKLALVYIGTNDMIADFLTKVQTMDKHRKFKIIIMGNNLSY